MIAVITIIIYMIYIYIYIYMYVCVMITIIVRLLVLIISSGLLLLVTNLYNSAEASVRSPAAWSLPRWFKRQTTSTMSRHLWV